MKRILPVFVVALVSIVALGETIRIGTMDLPILFEGDPPTGAIYDFTTNEIVRYYHPVIGFSAFSPNAFQPANINVRMKGTLVWRSPVFRDKIKFSVDLGVTNCIVSAAFVTNVIAFLDEWTIRTNLVSSAEQFLFSVSSGTVTNRPLSELRKRFRALTPDGAMLVPASENDGPNSELFGSFAELSSFAEFEPLCAMEMFRHRVGTNEVWMVPVRTFWNRGPGNESDIAPLQLVLADNEWCFMF